MQRDAGAGIYRVLGAELDEFIQHILLADLIVERRSAVVDTGSE